MKHYKVKWHNYSLSVSCKKCGNNIPFGNFDGHPECNECGYVAKENWEEVLRFVEVQTIKKNPQGHKTILGTLQSRSNVEPVKGINCNSCNQELVITHANSKDANPICTNCNESIPLKQYSHFPDLLFYGNYVHKNKVKSKTPIVLQCFTCAAPLKVINDEVQLHCDACGNDNVFNKPSANEQLFSDIFVGVKVETFPKERMHESSREIVSRVLLDNKREVFTDEELDTLLKKFPNSEAVFNAINFSLRYKSTPEVYQFLWEQCKNTDMLRNIGKQLEKPKEEIQAKLESINPALKPNPTLHTKAASKKPDPYIIGFIIVTVIVMIIALIFS